MNVAIPFRFGPDPAREGIGSGEPLDEFRQGNSNRWLQCPRDGLAHGIPFCSCRYVLPAIEVAPGYNSTGCSTANRTGDSPLIRFSGSGFMTDMVI